MSPQKLPKWLDEAMELLDRFERRHKDVAHINFTQEGFANALGKSRMTVSKALREDDEDGIPEFRERYNEVKKNLSELGDKQMTAARKKRLDQDQRIRKLEREKNELQKQLEMANLRWMAACRIASKKGWDSFLMDMHELVNPLDPRLGDLIQKEEE